MKNQTGEQKLQHLSIQMKCPRSKHRYNKNRNWNEVQLYKFASFLHFKRPYLKTESQRKQSKIFAIMSKYIETRNTNQCRNYTHKLLNKFKTIDRVNIFLKDSLAHYDEELEKQDRLIDQLVFPPSIVSQQLKMSKQISVTAQKQVEFRANQLLARQQLKQCFNDLRPTDIDYPDNTPVQKNKKNGSFTESKENAKNQEEWMQCHQVYLLWTNKLKLLHQKENLNKLFAFISK